LLFRKKIPYSENDFESVVKACQDGNPQAQRVLFKKYFSYAKSISLRYASTREEAEEVLNEGFLKVFQNLAKYDPMQPFKPWIRTILINTAISYYRKHGKHQNNSVTLEDAPYPRFDDQILENITADEILELVQMLRPVYRTVFMMYAIDGYNHREIADLLAINEATVRSHYVRARARLQHLIKQYYPDLFPKDLGIQSYKQNEN
jgi:RNA polymerase sigma-70 factor, ECF subfamily